MVNCTRYTIKKTLSLSDQTSLFALLTFLLFKMSNIRPENSKLVLDFIVCEKVATNARPLRVHGKRILGFHVTSQNSKNPKSQRLLRFYPRQAEDLFKTNIFASFQRDGVIRFENRAKNNFVI